MDSVLKWFGKDDDKEKEQQKEKGKLQSKPCEEQQKKVEQMQEDKGSESDSSSSEEEPAQVPKRGTRLWSWTRSMPRAPGKPSPEVGRDLSENQEMITKKKKKKCFN
ncbi:splicing regulatory glutamine/lysine-rich protein 1-like isoform X1 [Equus przewalskii]|uniref:Splicing regulatory glutamine/lysine-rich protein 1-like isoform X1 n=1 Tax=Equus przewalskii TaxID=9798 RepID=A0ABM2EYC2_EQUPR|nr:PREDICTED: nucleolar and coiled-body phosphoprotein 1-like isoform X1 [Equus przewalskii]XP_008516405.1 PREDICTED: nucleolar and coiled-body phosphoprotein 1-like isoform X1 [Equus przewalskii]XP_023473139.1 zinc finger matrin-type protein CG9776-like [Equus caballus]